MSGHSKWATIKHKKGALDAKRGRIWSKAIKEITIAARLGGGDPGANPRLRSAVQAAKAVNMPADNIERAIKKGTGELEGASYEDASYEGYGPGGVALLITVTTDNKNRTVSEIRSILSKHGGNMGESGCVNWMFSKKVIMTIPKSQASESDLLDVALNAGAEDLVTMKDFYEIITPFELFDAVKHALEQKKLTPALAELTMIPQSTVPLNEEKARQMLKLMEALEDHDDVQKVYANFDVPEDVMEKIASE